MINKRLTKFPEIGQWVTNVNLSYNKIKELPLLSNQINYLDLSFNQLSSVQNLPMNLFELDLSNNNLQSLPDLPEFLIQFTCHNNPLQLLPKMNPHLQLLFCVDNPLKTQYIKLTKSIAYIRLTINNGILFIRIDKQLFVVPSPRHQYIFKDKYNKIDVCQQKMYLIYDQPIRKPNKQLVKKLISYQKILKTMKTSNKMQTQKRKLDQ